MTSDQSCPLCEKEMYYDSDDDLYECQSEACFLYAQEFFESDLEVLASQITRIRQEAKQEVFDDFPYNFDPRFENEIRKLNPVLDIDKIIKWKKKHGVE